MRRTPHPRNNQKVSEMGLFPNLPVKGFYVAKSDEGKFQVCRIGGTSAWVFEVCFLKTATWHDIELYAAKCGFQVTLRPYWDSETCYPFGTYRKLTVEEQIELLLDSHETKPKDCYPEVAKRLL